MGGRPARQSDVSRRGDRTPVLDAFAGLLFLPGLLGFCCGFSLRFALDVLTVRAFVRLDIFELALLVALGVEFGAF
jgi:hypothetical protein